MLLQIFLGEHSPACIEFPDDHCLTESSIKQFLVQYLNNSQVDTVSKEVLGAFNEGNWEMVDDDGDLLVKGTPKRAVAPQAVPAGQVNIMTKIEQLQELKPQIDQLQAEIDLEHAELTARVEALESKRATAEKLIEERQALSQELLDLQKLLNELLPHVE